MKNLIFPLLILMILFSCEEKPIVIPAFDPIASEKVVLVEELTGVRCPNCPSGTARLQTIKELYPENAIIVGIHGIELANPLPESKYDFRNDAAVFLENYLKVFIGKPAAYFNRVKIESIGGEFGNSLIGTWQSTFEEELKKPTLINIGINKTYNPDTRVLEIEVITVPQEDLSGEYKVNIMIVENEIVDAQDNQFLIIEDYEHNHVLRGMITSFDGDFLTNTLTIGKSESKKYTYTVPTDEQGLWREEHLEIIAFISDTEGESKEVLQAASAHLMD